GAVGVLPKTVKHADVSKVLCQLSLLPDWRECLVVVDDHYDVSPMVLIHMPKLHSIGELVKVIRSAVMPLLKEFASEMRRFVLASLESFARRLASEQKAAAAAAQPDVAEPPAPMPAREPRRAWALTAAIAAVALLSTLVLAVLYTRSVDATRAALQ